MSAASRQGLFPCEAYPRVAAGHVQYHRLCRPSPFPPTTPQHDITATTHLSTPTPNIPPTSTTTTIATTPTAMTTSYIPPPPPLTTTTATTSITTTTAPITIPNFLPIDTTTSTPTPWLATSGGEGLRARVVAPESQSGVACPPGNHLTGVWCGGWRVSAGERLPGTILFGDFGDFGVSFAATVTLT